MADRYNSMRAFQEDLNRLCVLCGVEESDISIPKASRFVEFAELLARDTSLNYYLCNQRIMVRNAEKKLKERQTDLWNMEQNEKLLDELEAQEEKLKKELADSRAEAKRYKSLAEGAQAGDAGKEAGSVPEWIEDTITMRDHLQASLDWAKDTGPADADVIRVLQGQLRETAQMLSKAGVEILDATGGPLDQKRHIVRGVRGTESGGLDGTVALTVRAGYVFRGEMLRGQEVYLYQKQQTEQSAAADSKES